MNKENRARTIFSLKTVNVFVIFMKNTSRKLQSFHIKLSPHIRPLSKRLTSSDMHFV